MSARKIVHDVVISMAAPPRTVDVHPKVRVGQDVRAGELLAEADADKVVVELVAPADGRVIMIAPEGTSAHDAVLVRIESDEAIPHDDVDASAAPAVPPSVEPGEPREPDEQAREPRAGGVRRPRRRALGEHAKSSRDAITTIDPRPLAARVSALTARGESNAEPVELARALALALRSLPEITARPSLVVLHQDVHGEIEQRTTLRVTADGEVTDAETDAVPDAVVLQFRETVDHAFVAPRASILAALVVGAPREIAEAGEGGLKLAPRVTLTLNLARPPGETAAVLSLLVRELTRA